MSSLLFGSVPGSSHLRRGANCSGRGGSALSAARKWLVSSSLDLRYARFEGPELILQPIL